jgi:hypothetical protein
MPDQSKVWNPGKNVNAPSRLWLCEDSAEDSLPSYRQGDDISALVSSAKQCPIASPGSEEPKVHCEQIGKDPTDNALSYAPLRADHSSSNLIRLRNEATALRNRQEFQRSQLTELANTDFASWAKESYEIGTKIAYRNRGQIGIPKGGNKDCRDVQAAAASFSSITLSARYSKDCGIVRPICFAFLRLITSSNNSCLS